MRNIMKVMMECKMGIGLEMRDRERKGREIG